jgi:signal transduction histidine kinase
MPEQARQLLEAMACLGGRAELSLLQAATAQSSDVVDQALAPSLAEGLLVAEPWPHPAVRFRHDRIREAILGGLDPRRRRTLQLAMARRLAAVPELFAVAAEQYLPVADAVDDAAERRQVAGLLRRAAEQVGLIGDFALVNVLLTTALPLIDPEETVTLAIVRAGRHAALYGLGRLEEADEEYRAIGQLRITAVERAGATAVQVRSLTHRKRIAEAIELGAGSLRELGITVPAEDLLDAEIEQRFDYLRRWLDNSDGAGDLALPEITDPALLAAARLIGAMMPAAYFADFSMNAWLSLEATRMWIDHGPSRVLLGPASYAASHAVELCGDYATGYRTARRLLAVGRVHAYEPGLSEASFVSAVISWNFEPLENGVQVARRAREGLIAGGDLANAGYTYYPTVTGLLDCAPTLDACMTEVAAGLAFLRWTGNEQSAEALDTYRWLASVLRGQTGPSAEAIPIDRYAGNPLAALYAHVTRAVAAAIFGDSAGLERHSAAAMPLLPAARGLCVTALAHLLRGLALAGQARTVDGAERRRVLAELDGESRWLAARAAGAPDNFGHLLRLIEAERAWVAGDFHTAAVAFDAARRDAAQRVRPWHRALIDEHAGCFYLAHGVEQIGYDLIAQSRQEYTAWGATAKAAQLDWAYAALRPAADLAARTGPGQPGDLPKRRAAVTRGTVDLLGVVSASQALSSETSIRRLYARVVQVLSAMTGATGIRLLLWSDDGRHWRLPAMENDGGTVPVGGAGQERAAPSSVLRYVERTREPLLVADALGDDRFARDPYFADVDCCSLLAVPIVSRGLLRAVLLMENRLIRGAFTTARLDAVQLIAGQLAVSLDNAQLYAELSTSRARIVAAADQARRRIERDLHDGAQQRLVSLALRLRATQAAAPPALAAELDRAVAEAMSAMDELRETARGIHPAVLTEGGLHPALKVLARRSPVRVDLRMPEKGRLPEPVEVSAYYIVAEALTNAAKHARSSAVSVNIEVTGQVLHVTVHDDGVGGADLTRGTGLAGLKDRVEAIGGLISLDSPRGAGTALHVELPLTVADGDITVLDGP